MTQDNAVLPILREMHKARHSDVPFEDLGQEYLDIEWCCFQAGIAAYKAAEQKAADERADNFFKWWHSQPKAAPEGNNFRQILESLENILERPGPTPQQRITNALYRIKARLLAISDPAAPAKAAPMSDKEVVIQRCKEMAPLIGKTFIPHGETTPAKPTPDAEGLIGRLLFAAKQMDHGSLPDKASFEWAAKYFREAADALTAANGKIKFQESALAQAGHSLMALDATNAALAERAEKAERLSPFWDALFSRFPNWKNLAGDALALTDQLEAELTTARQEARKEALVDVCELLLGQYADNIYALPAIIRDIRALSETAQHKEDAP